MNRKSGVNGVLRFPNNATAPACLRRSVYAKLRACFFAVVYARGPTHRLFPGRLSDAMREAMPSTLSFDDFLAACQRRCAAAFALIR